MKRFKVYWNIIVENNMVADFDTLAEAKHYCDENTKEYEECTGNYERCCDNFCYEVYDGEKDILDEDGNVVDFHSLTRVNCRFTCSPDNHPILLQSILVNDSQYGKSNYQF